MADEKKPNVLLDNLATLSEPDNFQKFVLGYKKHGQPRAIYDVVKDMTKVKSPKKKHKKKKKSSNGAYDDNTYNLYLKLKGDKKKHKKKKNKYWHI